MALSGCGNSACVYVIPFERLVFFTGCAVGPNYKRPVVVSPAVFRGDSAPTNSSFADLDWWQVYQDTTLQALVREALTNNFDLRITAVVPPDATSGRITIVTAHGNVTSTASFQVLPPPLSISLSATDGVVIRWPATGSAFVLEATDDLAAGSWSVVYGLTMDLGQETRIDVPAPKRVRFFRLRSR